MKKNLLLISVIIGLMTVFCTGFSSVNAQSPPAFKYQAVARNLNGDPVIDQEIAVKISILSGSETGPVVYSELHEIPTNQMGLFTIEIGNATYVLFGNFSEIGWGYSTHFMKTEIDISGGSNYQLMGVSQLLSVPYALYANEAANAQNYTAGAGINVSDGVITNTANTNTTAPATNTTRKRVSSRIKPRPAVLVFIHHDARRIQIRTSSESIHCRAGRQARPGAAVKRARKAVETVHRH